MEGLSNGEAKIENGVWRWILPEEINESRGVTAWAFATSLRPFSAGERLNFPIGESSKDLELRAALGGGKDGFLRARRLGRADHHHARLADDDASACADSIYVANATSTVLISAWRKVPISP